MKQLRSNNELTLQRRIKNSNKKAIHTGDGFWLFFYCFVFFVKAWQDMKGWTKLLNTGRQGSWFPTLEAWKAEPMPEESTELERRAVAAICYKAVMLKDSENLNNVALHLFLPSTIYPGAASETFLVPLPPDSRLFKCLPWFWVSVLGNLLQSVRREDVHGQLSGSK